MSDDCGFGCEVLSGQQCHHLPKKFSNFCRDLWNADKNRLTEGEEFTLNLGRTTSYYNKEDKNKEKLFTDVSKKVITDKLLKGGVETMVDPDCEKKYMTYQKFFVLLNNYTSVTGKREVVTDKEKAENRDFIDEICLTEVMSKALLYLTIKGKIPRKGKELDWAAFKKFLNELWFTLYRRGGSGGDSSGFEHVFVGETRGSEVIGFHNWIQFYAQENAGNVDYMGYMRPRKEKGDRSKGQRQAAPHLLQLQFSWNGLSVQEDDTVHNSDSHAAHGKGIKPLGSSFIGTSPEFEIALYTVCYMMGYTTYWIYLDVDRDSEKNADIDDDDDDKVTITVHRNRSGIGSCFPSVGHVPEKKGY